ncbi:thioredoxin-like protein [Entophlyctis helioformis]|nr:thioredoxin-like protein [Entophlyctis helioformis]
MGSGISKKTAKTAKAAASDARKQDAHIQAQAQPADIDSSPPAVAPVALPPAAASIPAADVAPADAGRDKPRSSQPLPAPPKHEAASQAPAPKPVAAPTAAPTAAPARRPVQKCAVVVGGDPANRSSTMVVKIQHKAPAFTAPAVVNGDFKEVSLDDYKGKYLVLFFYPLDFTFVCPTEIIAFSDRIEEFKKLGVEVVAASVDSKFSHLAWVQTPRKAGGLGEMKIPIIADITKQISRDYGVLLEDGEDAGVALRGTFIIDPEQKVRVSMINDLPIGRSVDEVLRLIEALQFNAEHGEVCPAGWHKGDATIDTASSKAYFEKVNA